MLLNSFCMVNEFSSFFYSNMDDTEYYKKMRDGYSHYSFLFKNNSKLKKKTVSENTRKKWETFQGREDAQILQEKTKDISLQNNESLSDED